MKRELTAALFALCLSPALADTAPPRKERYQDAMDLVATAPAAAHTAMAALADTGYPRAIDRLAQFTAKGVGVTADPATAMVLYAQAIDQGHAKSLVAMGKLLANTGDHAQALKVLEQAQAQNVKGADVALAVTHATGKLGPLSDQDAGWDTLLTLAQRDRHKADTAMLYVAYKTGLAIENDHVILTRVTDRARDGDGRAAESLLRYYRVHKPSTDANVAFRLKLTQHPGVRPKVQAEEALHLAAIVEPAQFWTAAQKVVQAQTDEAFTRALVVTSKLNRNAYVRILQIELGSLGYLDGRPNGYLTHGTIRAFNAFCRDAQTTDACRYGPLKSAAVKAVSVELAKRRASRT
ncbi:MAG: hypothetical protein AAGF71_02985 [Pseudomonadota bacterium]